MAHSARNRNHWFIKLYGLISLACFSNACTWDYFHPDMTDLKNNNPADCSLIDLSMDMDPMDFAVYNCNDVSAIPLTPGRLTLPNMPCSVSVAACPAGPFCTTLVSKGTDTDMALCIQPIDYDMDTYSLPNFGPGTETAHWTVNYQYGFISESVHPRAHVSILLLGANSEILNIETSDDDIKTTGQFPVKSITSMKPIRFIRVILSSANEANRQHLCDGPGQPKCGQSTALILNYLNISYSCK